MAKVRADRIRGREINTYLKFAYSYTLPKLDFFRPILYKKKMEQLYSPIIYVHSYIGLDCFCIEFDFDILFSTIKLK